MSEELEQNNQIALFMEISGKRWIHRTDLTKIIYNFFLFFLKGVDFDTARQTLTVNNFNLEQAINYHLERSNAIGAPEDDVAGNLDESSFCLCHCSDGVAKEFKSPTICQTIIFFCWFWDWFFFLLIFCSCIHINWRKPPHWRWRCSSTAHSTETWTTHFTKWR